MAKRYSKEFGGKVFIIFSLDGEIANKDIIPAIEVETNRLSTKS